MKYQPILKSEIVLRLVTGFFRIIQSKDKEFK